MTFHMAATTYLSALKRPPPRVAILLYTCQGEESLAEQLDSFAAQTHSNWVVWASDGGSADDTPAILAHYQEAWGTDKLVILSGPTDGATRNFMSLAHNPDIQADYYAFSGQDGIWEADKLQRAIAQLERNMEPGDQDTPALYCSRTRYVDAENHERGLSRLFRKPPGFANALTQNIAGSNTMVFNQGACRLLRSVRKTAELAMHDWWVYIVVSGCGGTVLYDAYPSLRRRRHSGEGAGMDSMWRTRLYRFRQLFEGRHRQWNEQHILALQQLEARLTPRNRQVLLLFAQARQSWLLPRLAKLAKAGVYRQTLSGDIGLVLAAIFNKL